MKIVSVKQMQTIEKAADAAGLSYEKMMLNAGRGIAEWVYQRLNLMKGVIGLVGSGNNGGDTLIALSELSKRGARTFAFLAKQRHDDPLIEDYALSGGVLIDLSQNGGMDRLKAALSPGVVILDGILGTGLKLPIRGDLHDVMGHIQNLIKNCPDTLLIAIDCPSGVDCDSGEVSDVTFSAKDTLCMAAIKQGLLKHPAMSTAGNLHLIDIGLAETSVSSMNELPEMIDLRFIKENLPTRPDTGHKGTFGTCLVVAGSAAYTGAAFLTGNAAYRSGCGLVNIGTISSVHKSLSGKLIEAIWTVLPDVDGSYEPRGVDLLRDTLTKTQSLVVGPGWGVHGQNEMFLRKLLGAIPKGLPALFDADGLKLLSRLDHWWGLLPTHSILTPHPGEMSILTGLDIREIQANRWAIAVEYAKLWGVVVLLKGAVTVIGTPKGELYVNPVSDSALATAGSGDVLSGVIGGLMAQGVMVEEAAVIGAWLHAQAGIAARKNIGTDISVTATDILNSIGKAFIKAIEAGF